VRATALLDVRTFGEIDLPEPRPGPGEVLVRVAAVSICGSDVTAYIGGHTRTRLPTVLGHEFSGVVEQVGPEVSGISTGQRAAIDPTFGCGTCRLCLAGRKNICREYTVLGRDLQRPGGMAGRVVVPASHVNPIPDALSFAEGAIVQPLSVAYHAAIHRGQIARGETVLVMGAGAIGLAILLHARSQGAHVIVSDVVAGRLEMATNLGAEVVIDVAQRDVADAVLEATDGLGADVAFEAVGGRDDGLLMGAVRAVAPGGRVVVVGMKMPEARIPVIDLKFDEKTVLGSQAHPASFPAVIDALATADLPFSELITHRFRAHDVPAAFDLLERRAEGVIKVVIELQEQP
jgi:L-iditol 2-dehydrogenase